MDKMTILKIIKIEYKKIPLKALRKKSGLSLRQLSSLSGVSFAHINKFENGLTMSETSWKKIKKALNSN